ncbi:MAG: CvpA family protein [Thermoguttaceae bacterium]
MSQTLQPYDFVMLAVLVVSIVFGAIKGVAWQLAALGSVVISAAVAVHSSAVLAPHIHISDQEPWNRFVAMLALFVATGGAIWLLFRLVSGLIDRLRLKEFDRQLGVLFGLAKGAAYCVILTFFAVTLSESSRQLVLESKSGPLIARGIRDATPILPNDVRTWLGKYIDELDTKLNTPIVPGAPNTDLTNLANMANTVGTGSSSGVATPSAATKASPSTGTKTSAQPSEPKKKLRDYLPKLK